MKQIAAIYLPTLARSRLPTSDPGGLNGELGQSMTKASELKRTLVAKESALRLAHFSHRELLVSFVSHRPKAMFSCF
jgi:hypothetical protein